MGSSCKLILHDGSLGCLSGCEGKLVASARSSLLLSRLQAKWLWWTDDILTWLCRNLIVEVSEPRLGFWVRVASGSDDVMTRIWWARVTRLIVVWWRDIKEWAGLTTVLGGVVLHLKEMSALKSYRVGLSCRKRSLRCVNVPWPCKLFLQRVHRNSQIVVFVKSWDNSFFRWCLILVHLLYLWLTCLINQSNCFNSGVVLTCKGPQGSEDCLVLWE